MALFNRKRNKDEHRYYLLPGMGRSNRRRRQEIFKWAIVVGLVAAMIFGVALYYLNRF
jgi:ABC-type multidrug transport system permease subunit